MSTQTLVTAGAAACAAVLAFKLLEKNTEPPSVSLKIERFELQQQLADARTALKYAKEDSAVALVKANMDASASIGEALKELEAARKALAEEQRKRTAENMAHETATKEQRLAAEKLTAELKDKLSVAEKAAAAATQAASEAEEARSAVEARLIQAEAVQTAAAAAAQEAGACPQEASIEGGVMGEAVTLKGKTTVEAAELLWSNLRRFAAEHGRMRSLDLFRKFDADRSGALDAKEFKEALASCGFLGVSTKVVKEVMKHAGLNATGSGVPYGAFVVALSKAQVECVSLEGDSLIAKRDATYNEEKKSYPRFQGQVTPGPSQPRPTSDIG